VPTLFEIGSLRIRLYAGDHNPPHFHVVTSDGEALVRIADMTMLRGSIRRRDLETALEWARGNRRLLDDEWRRLNGE